MKIYTEVNYKWIDGSLVQTSSESFDYTGDLTLCGGGGGGGSKGGGGGGGGGTLGQITSSVSDAASSVGTVVEDVGGTAVDLGTTVADAAGGATADAVGTTLNEATGAITRTGTVVSDTATAANEDITFIADSLAAPLETAAANIGDAGDMIGEGITSGAAATGAALNEGASALQTNAQGAQDYLGDRVNSGMQYGRDILDKSKEGWHDLMDAGDQLNFMKDRGGDGGGGGGGGAEETDLTGTGSGSLKDRKASLKINKSKDKSRKSLKIGRKK